MRNLIWKKWPLVLFAVAVTLTLLQIIFFYLIAMNTGLPGRRGGPQDAFKHTYACAVVAKYISPRVVMLVTRLSERDSKSPHDTMDIHNNMNGIRIGLTSASLYKAVNLAVTNGQINANEIDQTRWLPEDHWNNGF